MFGFFKSATFIDPQLGEFEHKRGAWRGSIKLDATTAVPLVLSGGRAAPDDQALSSARTLPADYASWRPVIEHELFEHYSALAESISDGDADEVVDIPRIAAPAGVWQHVNAVFVQVTPLDGVLTVEIGYSSAWDEEHTLGARFRAGQLLELNGSVLNP